MLIEVVIMIILLNNKKLLVFRKFKLYDLGWGLVGVVFVFIEGVRLFFRGLGCVFNDLDF